MKIPEHRKGLLLICITALLWSSSGLFIKVLSLDAYQISFYRSGIAAITVLIISAIRKTKLDLKPDWISLSAAVSYSLVLILFVVATKLTKAANAIFLQFTAPLYLLFLEPVFLKTKFRLKYLIVVVLCLTGMFLFFAGRLEAGDFSGNIIAVLAGVAFAFFSLFLKMKKNKDKNADTLGILVMGNIFVALVAAPIIYPNFGMTTTEVLMLLYMGVFQIGISYMIFNAAIKYVSATEAMIIATLEAVFNPIWVFIGIGEKPGVYSIIGAGIIAGTILWFNLTSAKKTNRETTGKPPLPMPPA